MTARTDIEILRRLLVPGTKIATLADVIPDDDPVYELFNTQKQTQIAYRKAIRALARRTGYTVRQVAKFMQSRRRGKAVMTGDATSCR